MDKDLLYSFFSGTVTEKEVASVRLWFESSPENRKVFFQERKLFDTMSLLIDGEKKQGSNIRRYPVHRPSQRRMVKLRIPHMAAMLAVVFTMGILANSYFNSHEKLEIAWYEIAAPLGAKSQLSLIDGTKVWLNAGSRLLYSTQFGQNTRQVQLEGEAYFEVARNTSLPFEVKTSKISIKALGTAFNVKAYPGEETIETILVDGKIEVSRNGAMDEDEPVLLQPNQRLTFVKTTNELLFETEPQEKKPETQVVTGTLATDTLPVPQQKITPKVRKIEASTDFMMNTSWKDKRWRIESEELGSFATKLERRYNVKISFSDNDLPKYKFNGTFEDEPIEEVLRALALAAPIKFSLKGNKVFLSRNNQFKKAHQSLYEQSW